jgi:hypothetical protein
MPANAWSLKLRLRAADGLTLTGPGRQEFLVTIMAGRATAAAALHCRGAIKTSRVVELTMMGVALGADDQRQAMITSCLVGANEGEGARGKQRSVGGRIDKTRDRTVANRTVHPQDACWPWVSYCMLPLHTPS